MDLSVVVPIFREASTLPELAQRCSAAAGCTGLEYEVLFVDDASGDSSPDTIRGFPALLRARVLELGRNQGQFGATQAGLREAKGAMVVVLVAAHQHSRVSPGRRVTFAVKHGRRSDPLWFLVGHRVFRAVQRYVGTSPPPNSGSYCVMDREVAQTVARVQLRDPNLAWVLAALGYEGGAVSYVKEQRADGASRMGPWRLSREALGSLFISTRVGRSWLRRHLRP